MISIMPPRIKNSETLKTFSSHVLTLAPKQNQIRQAYCDYLKSSGNLTSLVPIVVSAAEKSELLSLYKSTYKKKVVDKYKLNWVYELRNSDDHPYCPMCGNVGWSAIEHYLPESHYPEFAFFSLNLVPTCSSCNGKRLHHANAPGTTIPLLHPYIEGSFLGQSIVTIDISGKKNSTGISFEMPAFKLIPAIQTVNPLYSRLSNHIEKCVSSTQLKRWSKYMWIKWRDKANIHTTLPSFQRALSRSLKREVALGGNNSWTAAFLRGLQGNAAAIQWILQNPI